MHHRLHPVPEVGRRVLGQEGVAAPRGSRCPRPSVAPPARAARPRPPRCPARPGVREHEAGDARPGGAPELEGDVPAHREPAHHRGVHLRLVERLEAVRAAASLIVRTSASAVPPNSAGRGRRRVACPRTRHAGPTSERVERERASTAVRSSSTHRTALASGPTTTESGRADLEDRREVSDQLPVGVDEHATVRLHLDPFRCASAPSDGSCGSPTRKEIEEGALRERLHDADVQPAVVHHGVGGPACRRRSTARSRSRRASRRAPGARRRPGS